MASHDKGRDEKSRRPENHLPLTPAVFHVLLALADGDVHGYAIMKEVEARTGGRSPRHRHALRHRQAAAGRRPGA